MDEENFQIKIEALKNANRLPVIPKGLVRKTSRPPGLCAFCKLHLYVIHWNLLQKMKSHGWSGSGRQRKQALNTSLGSTYLQERLSQCVLL